MKESYFLRKIDELGRIVIPVEIRQNLNLKEKDLLEISMQDNNILVKKNVPCCVFCNSTNNLKPFSEKNICTNCINKLNKLIS